MDFKLAIIKALFLTIATCNLSYPLHANEDPQPEEKWSCSGWCFMGGDTPTNPWIPVSSSGSTEQEARDNIDCGIYEEAGITCRRVQ